MPAVEDRSHDGAGDVVPEGEDRGRQRRERVRSKVHRGERDAEARILHADFDREALALGEVHARCLRKEVAEEHAEAVMEDNDREDKRTGREDLRARGGDDGGDDEDDRDDGDEREDRNRSIDAFAKHLVDNDAQGDRDQHDLNDRDEHAHRIDVKPLARKEVHERGGDKGGEERRAGRDRDGKRHVAAREEGHHVRGGAARAAAHEHHADGEFRRERKNEAEHVGRHRHDDELAEDADQHVSRVLEDFTEVIGREREAHAEHHYAKQNRYPSAQRLAKIRERVSDNAEYEHPKRECFVDESAEFG